MLQYDLTLTQVFDAPTRSSIPSEAEMFAMTIALLLVRDMAYNDLEQFDLELRKEDLNAVAECIEYRLFPLGHDFGDPERLRNRLRELVGMRISRQVALFPGKPT
jgi:hypothetical protein